jgi:uncharacterized protein (DUF2147 family)
LGIAGSVDAQIDSIVGKWKSVDDKTGAVQAIIKIYKGSNGLYYGKIDALYVHANARCDLCEGDEKGKPVLGMIIIKRMKEENGLLKDGYILDPESGKTYYASINFDVKTNKLKLRGSLDKFGVLGRSQYWIR